MGGIYLFKKNADNSYDTEILSKEAKDILSDDANTKIIVFHNRIIIKNKEIDGYNINVENKSSPKVITGFGSSFIITERGDLYAFGNNNNNPLLYQYPHGI